MAVEPKVERADPAFRDLVTWIHANQCKHSGTCVVLNGVTIELTLLRHGKPRPGVVVKFTPQVPDNTVFAYLELQEHDVQLRISEGPQYVIDGRQINSVGSRVELLAEVLTTLDPYILDSYIHYPKDG